MSTTHKEQAYRKRMAYFGACLAAAGLLLIPSYASAQSPVLMQDGGSTANVDLTGGSGMNSWTVNGQNQLNQQWFWYQTSGGVAQAINTIGTPTVSTSSGADGINNLTAVYQNSQLKLTINYALSGGGVGSGNADITESIMAQNISGSAFTLNFYQYSAFNLLGEGNDTVQIFGSPGDFLGFRQANGSTAIAEAIASPDAQYAEAAAAGYTLNRLNTVSGLTLNDNLTSGPGIETASLQWGVLLNPGDEFDLTKDKSISISVTPEPSTLSLLAFGVGAAGFALRRRKSV